MTAITGGRGCNINYVWLIKFLAFDFLKQVLYLNTEMCFTPSGSWNESFHIEILEHSQFYVSQIKQPAKRSNSKPGQKSLTFHELFYFFL